MDDFDYGESMVFDHVGDAFLLYSPAELADRRRVTAAFRARVPAAGSVARLGRADPRAPLGSHRGVRGDVRRRRDVVGRRGEVGRTGTGMGVVSLQRRYRLDGDRLTYELDMQTDDVGMSGHLAAALHRVSS